jgi:hypothetical protein
MGCARAGLLFPLPVAQLARVVNSTLSPKMGMRGEIGEPLLKALWVMRRTCTTLFLMKSLLLINYGETWIVNTYPYFLSVTALLSSALSSRLPNHGFYSFLLPPSRLHASSASPSPLSPPSQTLDPSRCPMAGPAAASPMMGQLLERFHTWLCEEADGEPLCWCTRGAP